MFLSRDPLDDIRNIGENLEKIILNGVFIKHNQNYFTPPSHSVAMKKSTIDLTPAGCGS